MANKVTIDVEARFVDHVSDGAVTASKSIKEVGTQSTKTQKELDKLSKKKPIFDADTNKLLKKLRAAEEKAAKLGKTKTVMVLQAMDKATNVIGKALNKAQSFAGKTYSAILKVKDSDAISTLKQAVGYGKELAGKTWTALVKIKDMALAPLTKIKNMLFNIKTLVAAVTAGLAMKQLVMNPINLADQYSSAQIGFSTLLGEAEGQKMMDQIDEFAKATPFKTSNVISNVQKMMAYGWDVDRVIKDMETIGDAAAATGKGDEGLGTIVYALSEIRSKGKLSTQELNQLASAGIKAKQYLAEGLGFGSDDAGMAKLAQALEKGSIGANQAIDLILKGMEEFDGMMDKTANETVQGLWSQIEDTFEINIFRRWGQGLQDGAKKGLGSLVSLLDTADEGLASVGDTLYEIGQTISNFAAEKLEKTVKTIQEIVASDDFKNADLGEKISMLWSGAIGNPLASWWENTVTPWLDKKAVEAGEAIGKGLTDGLLMLFGSSDTLVAGAEQGASVAGAFVKGFKEGFDGSAITRSLVDAILDVWEALPWWAKGLVAGKAIGGIGSFVGSVGNLVGGAQALAPAATSLIGSTGNSMVMGSGLSGLAASAGYGLTGGAAGSALTGGTAAAIGGGSILGGVAGGLGIFSGLKDIYRGIRSKGKEAKDRYFQGGTKIGLVGTGAATGAAIGSAIPGLGTAAGALIGGGIGGLGALFKGSDIGKWLSDFTDEGGGLSKAIDSVKKTFTDTIPNALSSAGEGISVFFTETLPEGMGNLWDGITEFLFEKVPYALGYASGKVAVFFGETVPEAFATLWDNISTFFTDTLPTWASTTWTNNIVPFFTEDIPEAFSTLWNGLTTFFTDTLPSWSESVWNDHIVPFFTEDIPSFFSELWGSVTGFFTESLPSIGDTIWSSISGFFTETLPGWASSALGSVGDFFGGIGDSFSKGYKKGSGYRGGIFGGNSAMEGFARGGIVGGSTRFIRVNEESPEMVIPLSSQRRGRALKLWAQAGNMMGVPGFARGGMTDGSYDEGIRFKGFSGGGSVEGGQNIQVDMGGVTVQINVEANGNTNIVDAIKEQGAEIAEQVAGILAEAFSNQFENTPIRGGVA